MRRILGILSISALSLIFACEDKPVARIDVEYKSNIVGLASPVLLNLDTTVIDLSEYFLDTVTIQSVEIEGLRVQYTPGQGHALALGNLPIPIGNMHVLSRDVDHDIPVFASEKFKHTFSYKPTDAKVKIVQVSGSMNGWNKNAANLVKSGEQWNITWTLNKGLYQYRIWEDGIEKMDANNPEKVDNSMGAFNNTFRVGPPAEKVPNILTLRAENNAIQLLALDSVVKCQVYFENVLIPHEAKGNEIKIDIPQEAKNFDRSHIRVFACNGTERSNDVLIPLTHGDVIMRPEALDRHDMQAAVMYFMMVDRFCDGDSSNNRPTDDPTILPKANNMGGDLAGITKQLKEGYFERMGVNTLWISPITTNAEGAWGMWDKGVKSTFSAYHGYWPVSLRTIDHRFGTESQLKELIEEAHKRDINVILDYVAHHVHQDHPLYKQRPEWTTPLYLPDGTMNTEKWDEHRLTTWFDTFLPTWNFAKPEVVDALTDTAMYWVENYELDGFRHDATKHIPNSFWKELTRKIKVYKTENPGRSIYQVGETYGSPELISSYISSGLLDAQFDFNLYDAAVDAFAKNESSFSSLGRVLRESMHYYGSHHTMGNITGNQDRARFTSYADGSVRFDEDAKLAGWTRKIENKGNIGLEKMRLLNTFLLTTPGIPCIYYGDEIGMPGGNDPDNRRMMVFNDLNSDQQNLRSITAMLIKLRRNNLALQYGDLLILKDDDQALVYVRTYFGQSVLVVIDKNLHANESWKVDLPPALQLSAAKSIMKSDYYNIQDNTLTCKAPAKDKPYVIEIFQH